LETFLGHSPKGEAKPPGFHPPKKICAINFNKIKINSNRRQWMSKRLHLMRDSGRVRDSRINIIWEAVDE
jgi:hypothetical protein